MMIGNSVRSESQGGMFFSLVEGDGENGNQFVFTDEGMNYTIEVLSSKLGLIIGHHGTKIKQLKEASKCGIEIVRGQEEISKIYITALSDDADPDLALSLINNIVLDPQPGQTYAQASITKVANFGVFVAIGEGREGLLHVSDVPLMKSGAISYNVGQKVNVVVTSVDDRGKIRLGLMQHDEDGILPDSNGIPVRKKKEALDVRQGEEWPALLGPMQESRDEWYARIRSQRKDASHLHANASVPSKNFPAAKDSNSWDENSRTRPRQHAPVSSPEAPSASIPHTPSANRSIGHTPTGPRHLGRSAQMESTGPTRNRMEQPRTFRVADADYSREYVLYAPKESAMGRREGVGLSRPSDRDETEAGGQEITSLRQRVAQARGRR